MISAIGVVGWHNAGKTRFIEALVRALKGRGLRVATIKHAHGPIEIDHPGTDTWRFAQAGSDLVIIAGHDLLAWLERPLEEPTLEAILARLPEDIQFVIVEGYKGSALPKFEVLRAGAPPERITPDEQLLALVTEADGPAWPGVPRISPEDAERALAILAAKGILPGPDGAQGERSR